MKQTLESAAINELFFSYACMSRNLSFAGLVYDRNSMLNMFRKGAEWQSKQSPWIRVEERLPDEGQHVLFIIEWRGIHKGYFAGSYKGGKWETEERTYNTISFCGIVTHWMPIPKFNE